MGTCTEIVIIGAGVIGVCTAHELSRSTRDIVVLDQGDICSGSSYGNAGLIVPSHCVPLAEPGVIRKGLKWMLDASSPFYIKPRLNRDLISWLWQFRRACTKQHVQRSMPVIRDLSLESLRLFEEIAGDDGAAFGFEQRGAVFLCRTEAGLEGLVEETERIRSIGIQADVLSEAEVRERTEPARVRAIGGVYYPQDAHLVPDRFVREVARRAAASGVTFRTETEVMGFERQGDRITRVRTTRGEIEAGEVVLAGGAWSQPIARDLDLHLPVQPAKGYSITVEPSAPNLPLPVMLTEAKVGVTPMGKTLRFAGTLELAGLDLSINQRRVQAIVDAVPHYLPEHDPARARLIEIWRGLRPCTPDGLPFLGRPDGIRNLTVAAGHATIGISLGPVTGRIASKVVLGEDPGFDLAPMRVDRFA